MIKKILDSYFVEKEKKEQERWEFFDNRQKAMEKRLSYIEEKLDDFCELIAKMQDTILKNGNVMQDIISKNGNIIQDVNNTEIWTANFIIDLSKRLANWEENWSRVNLSPSQTRGIDEWENHITRVQKYFPISELCEKYSLVRAGKYDDGGYVMLDDFTGVDTAYSFGISDDVSWDAEMAARGLNVYMYDHTIESLPEENIRFHWRKEGVTGQYNEQLPYMKTLEQFLEDNGHIDAENMILKMDIEGAEWEVFSNLDVKILEKFSQIIIEIHDLWKQDNFFDIPEGLERLNQTHALVHIHGNNYTKYLISHGKCLPDTMECTYVLRKKYTVRNATRFFPTSIDKRNCSHGAEIVLGWWGNADNY